ncbi:MAG: hypothetical protein HZB23_07220 [Deltaproteobacteria bacterium]|nr:hypothetical protein [Deltaproteobacteria bacterium]
METTEKRARVFLVMAIVAAGALFFLLVSVLQGIGYNKRALNDLTSRLKNIESAQQRLANREYEAQSSAYGRQAQTHAPSSFQLTPLQKSVDSLREGRFNDMVDEVTREASTDNERAVKMTAHVCATVRNECGDSSRHDYSKVKLEAISDPLTAWEYRLGVCGWRAHILVRALARMNIKAKIFNIYDYAFGHSCVLATYGGRDHFLDPTYGGYFADKDGGVLSWEEIAANPKAAAEGMMAFPKTLDCYPDGSRPHNASRMRDVYRPENIAAVKNAGVLGSRVFVLPVELDLSGIDRKPVVFGIENGSETDMRDEAVHRRTRCWYLDYLGANLDKFAYSLNLTGLSGKRPVDIYFKFCKSGQGGASWQASSRTGKILAGAAGPFSARAGDWLITYEPKGEGPQTVEIRLSQYKDRSWSRLDCLTVARAGQIKIKGGETKHVRDSRNRFKKTR